MRGLQQGVRADLMRRRGPHTGVALLLSLFSSAPALAQPAAEAAKPAPESWWTLHPSTAAGALLSWSTEKLTCDARGRFSCPANSEWTDTHPVNAAAFVEGVLMVGRRRDFRLGLGVRYVPPGMLDTGSELHFAIVPEIVGPIAPTYSLSARFFNSFALGLGPHDFERQQDALVRDCKELAAQASATCSAHRGGLGMALELDAGLIQHLEGVNVRYQLGFQAIPSDTGVASAVGELYSGTHYEDSADSRYTKYSVSSTRLVAAIGFEL
jgi:hypothetical protein